MEMNKKMVVVKVAFLLFLMGFSATVEAGRRLDPSFIISKVLNKQIGDAISSADDCCGTCLCLGPFCKCLDSGMPSCPAACKNCACTKSIPPQCWCNDVTFDFDHNCYLPLCKA